MKAEDVQKALKNEANPEKKKVLQGFFKTGKGQYGEGDVFLGVVVPKQRKVAKEFSSLPLPEIQKLLNSKIHEHRLTGLFILISQFERGQEKLRKKIYSMYVKNFKNVNNWDLVDSSAHKIVGAYLLDKSRKPLYIWAKSRHLWTRRIAIIATFAFIDKRELNDSLKLAHLLLKDSHDLMHKAVGWVLREVGKKDKKTLVTFLDKHASHMPRTALRYAIERFPERERQKFLNS